LSQWFVEKADWDKFEALSEEWLSCVDGSESNDVLTREIRSGIIAAADVTITNQNPNA